MSTKTTLSFALLILFTTFLKAQLTPIDLEAQLAEAFSPLDLTEVENSTNIFMDKMPQYLTLANHKGKYIADSTRLVANNYLFGYGMVSEAYIDNRPIPNVDSFQRKVRLYDRSNFVAISMTAFKYDRIKANAIEDSILIVIDSSEVDEGPNIAAGAFTLDTVFFASTIRSEFDSLVVPFYIDSSFYYTNMSAVTLIEIDFGEGYDTVAFGDVVNITFPDIGEYNS